MQRGEPSGQGGPGGIRNQDEETFERGYTAGAGNPGERGETGATGETGKRGGTGISIPVLIAIVSGCIAVGTFAFNFSTSVNNVTTRLDHLADVVQRGNEARSSEHAKLCLVIKQLDTDLRFHVIESNSRHLRRQLPTKVDC